jgi:hypothetical protein
MTDEHLWPEWMHPYLPKLENPKREEEYTTVSALARTAHGMTTSHQGHVYQRIFHVVCRECNNGWMSDIEKDTKEILIPLVQGQHVVLLRKHRYQLAKWLTLKVLTIDGEIATDSVINQSERAAFRELTKIPSGMKIWIAQHDSLLWYSAMRFVPVRGVTDIEDSAFTEGKNIQTTAIGFGHLFVLAFVARTLKSKFDVNVASAFPEVSQLYPIRDAAIAWPLPTLSDGGVDRLSNVIKQFPGWRAPRR